MELSAYAVHPGANKTTVSNTSNYSEKAAVKKKKERKENQTFVGRGLQTYFGSSI